VVPLSVFLRSDRFMGFSEEEAMKIESSLTKQLTDEQGAVDDEAAQIAVEEAALALEGVADE